jgi:uncharacterized protein (DUF2267 family)
MVQGPYALEAAFIEEVAMLWRLAEEARQGPDEHAIKERQFRTRLIKKGEKRHDVRGMQVGTVSLLRVRSRG